MAQIGFLRGLLSAFTSKSTTDGQMLFATDTHELFFDHEGTNNTVVRSAVQDKGAGRSFTYTDHVLTLKDGANNTLSTATIAPDIDDWAALEINANGHLIYTKSDQLEGVDFAISNHEDLILTLDE